MKNNLIDIEIPIIAYVFNGLLPNDIEFKVIDDSFFPIFLGSSKARKIIPIIKDAQLAGANAFVTAGAPDSNHARVVALASAQLGWPCSIVIHGKDDPLASNLKLMRMTGATLTFVDQNDVHATMQKAMDNFKEIGRKPYYIWGGGHSTLGASAFSDAVTKFLSKEPNWYPDYVFVASGTGGTQAGIHIGFKYHSPKTKVIGISVAREKPRGELAVKETAKDLCNFLRLPLSLADEIDFRDEWTGGGYGKTYPQLLSTIRLAARKGFITDPTYTGKALTAVFDMVESKEITPGAKVLFWHTGGIYNLLSSPMEAAE